ncbi:MULTISPECIES: pilus assembly protein [unclassified Acidovorax]|uniref:pilus assembly protein n=1 Tax=unclassified Acidovorax TaxID=2684926 RepID=UPI001C444D07|nr:MULTISPECIES: PilC/PilY family type IV pilus protein [unclassified Acidovorax]MBV7430252.1 pilus assembly protein PilY [Acidovorax sp. sif0732]MBV7451645.1 pilus assembly protein PilY [Acidovorax sp. sif0715]
MQGFTTRQLRRWTVLAMGLAATLPCLAQYTSDIDIYSGTSTSDPPNVLILLDNTANWNNAFTNEIAAMVSTINALPAGKFRVGLMLFTETGNPNNNVDGGYLRAAIRPLDAAYKTTFTNMLGSLDKLGDKSNGGKAGKTMAEAYYYFTGAAPNSGNNKVKADYAGNASGTAFSNAIYAQPNNALPSFAGSPYRSPLVDACARNYIIYISNGAAQDNNSDNTDASTRLSAAYAAAGLARPADITDLSPNGSQSNFADEWARFMKKSPSNITTYTMDVDRVTTGQGPGWSALLGSMAVNSGGEYFAVSSAGTDIAEKLVSIFNQLQASDSVFSSASLPVSVNARGTYQNQVFMGMFRPDPDSRPRWRGNLKQYQFGYDVPTDTLFLAGADGKAAVSGASGFISPTAISFWTSPSTFWAKDPMGTPPSASDSPDGEVVEKGGVAQLIRSAYATNQATRNLYTCIGCATGTNLATSTSARFSTSNSSLTSTLDTSTINWVRGTNNAAEVGPTTTPATTIRPSVHGDILHSRPAVVNYGGNTGVVVFYGSNDGMLRAINGNQSGNDAGAELWGFILQEHFGKLQRLHDNTPDIRLSTTLVIDETSASKPQPRDYFVDGPISVYQKVNADGSNAKVYLYVGMRRGGRFIYALDVTDPTQPKFLWRKSNTDTDSRLSVLGQTWSEPRVAKIKGHADPVLVMGGGYDAAAEDAATPGSTTMGNAVYVLDAFTGSVLKRFDTARSVPADVTLVDSDYDGYTDRAYAVDTGGNIYRIDLETPSSSAVSDWGIYKLAALAGTDTRKFFYAPDVVPTKTFTAVQVGSGDREKPLKGTTAGTDRFFTVFDDRTAKGTATSFTPILPGSLGLSGSTTDNMTNGCYFPMTAGEKVVNAATTFRGQTYFGTNKPTPPGNTCSANLGEARTYAAPLFCRAPASQKLNGGGLPPSPVAGFVTITYTQTNADGTTSEVTKQKEFVIGAPNPKESGIEAGKSTATLGIPRKRRFWYQENAR